MVERYDLSLLSLILIFLSSKIIFYDCSLDVFSSYKIESVEMSSFWCYFTLIRSFLIKLTG